MVNTLGLMINPYLLNIPRRWMFIFIREVIKMENGITLTHLATGYSEQIKLNTLEMRLATDNTNINESWQKLVESVYKRLGIWIEGNYELETIIVNGKERPLH